MFSPLPKQAEILEYRHGKMGISAVPGSGKTWTLSRLAADFIQEDLLAYDQEVLVVTLVNSSVNNFKERIRLFLGEDGGDKLLALGSNYRVRTLHGLANDIVRPRSDLVRLNEKFQIIDEREADMIVQEATRAWLQATPSGLDNYLNSEMDDSWWDRVHRNKLPELLSSMAKNFIRSAKDQRQTPALLRGRLDGLNLPLPLALMGCDIFEEYQRALRYREAVDFDDLIYLALQALETDDEYLERLRHRWPYILEDEAQDSSRLQEAILKLLAGRTGNWVRVGDPNQAIYETFTTANPKFLRQFVQRDDVRSQELPNSGRSTQSIIDLANYMVTWTMEEHPVEAVRDALFAPPFIQQTPKESEWRNPPDDPRQVHLVRSKFTPDGEVKAVVDSIERWLPENQDKTVAVLAPRNQRGFAVVDALQKRRLEFNDGLLRSSRSTRSSAGMLGNVLRYLSDPLSGSKLATVYTVWRRGDREDEEAKVHLGHVSGLLRKLARVEDFLWPGPQQDWLDELELAGEEPLTIEMLSLFRENVRRWQNAVILPVDQLLLTLARDLITEPTELAVAHKLAGTLRQAGYAHPDWRLPQMTGELGSIARNERRFLGFSEEDTGFDPDQFKGKVVVATVHKAKGLEWDRVYLMSVNNYDFPSAQEFDSYISEKWFLRDKLNLEAETLAQLETALSTDSYHWYEEGVASREARLDYVRERLRLLYVSVTRAREELVITWNSGRKGDQQPAIPFLALQSFWEDYLQALGAENE